MTDLKKYRIQLGGETKIKIKKDIADKLYKYQVEHTINLIRIISTLGSALDASDTGTGKTYTAIAACKQLNIKPLIICPKSIISTWKYVCRIFGVKPYCVVNYETAVRGVNGYVKICNGSDNYYEWDIPNKCLVIFDEAHKSANKSTLNGRLLVSCKNAGAKILLLSATIADKPVKFLIFSYILDFIKPEHVKEHNLHFKLYLKMMDKWLIKAKEPMRRIHKMLYPERGSRMRIDVLGEEFPETQISAIPYDMGENKEKAIEKEYKKIHDLIVGVYKKSNKGVLTQIMRSRQKIELLKAPTIVELSNDYLYNGFSVVIFVNFTDTLKTISKMMNTTCVIHGQQTLDQRDKSIQLFQTNKSRIIVCNIKAGGLGVSLHDLDGNHPRVSLISPTWNSVELKQALGRIHRVGAKSKSLQRIIYAARTVEEDIVDKIKKKLRSIDNINNGDLDLTNIEIIRKPIK